MKNRKNDECCGYTLRQILEFYAQQSQQLRKKIAEQNPPAPRKRKRIYLSPQEIKYFLVKKNRINSKKATEGRLKKS